MIIENIQQLLEHIETDKKAEELVDYINKLQIENKQLKKEKQQAIDYINNNGILDLNGYDLLEILGDKE